MVSEHSDATSGETAALALKILVAGGFGVGKTTLVGAVSEIRPLRTEELLSEAGRSVDDTGGVDRKVTTTVAMDFGRITIRSGLSLYLFGTPGQDRFWFLWDELAQGALGAVVLADTRRLEDCFPAVDYFEHRRIPFVVAVNCFTDARAYGAHEVSRALDLDRGPVVVHAQGHPAVPSQIPPLDGVLPRVEDQVVAVEHEPDRCHMRAPVGPDGRQLASAGAVRDERPPFLIGHLVCHAPILLARTATVGKAGRSDPPARGNHTSRGDGSWRRTGDSTGCSTT
ncbi:hypothetical protein GCM10010372_40580 [Streptomyces tauricus]|nr:hypothetical protein GCM10010372_40580 [Streptomyces tauricus]